MLFLHFITGLGGRESFEKLLLLSAHDYCWARVSSVYAGVGRPGGEIVDLKAIPAVGLIVR